MNDFARGILRFSSMKRKHITSEGPAGFSLAEVLAALTIGAMILVAVLAVHNRAERSAAAITRHLDSSRLPAEVLQLIAEDIDRIVPPGTDTKVTIENKFDDAFATARLTILKSYYNRKDQKQTFEEIIWQSSYDNDANGLVLYRSYNGIGFEDKLLEEKRADWEKEYSFVPICAGATFFSITTPDGKTEWKADSLPNGIVAIISFAEPFKTLDGTMDVLDEQKITRTITIDRTRKPRFVIKEIEFDINDINDVNDVDDANDVQDSNDVEDTNDANSV